VRRGVLAGPPWRGAGSRVENVVRRPARRRCGAGAAGVTFLADALAAASDPNPFLEVVVRTRTLSRAACGTFMFLSLVGLASRSLAACDTGVATLDAPTRFSVGESPAGIVTGDFDHDGIQDVVVALSHLGGSYPGEIAFLRGQGTDGRGSATFEAPVTFGWGNGPLFLAAADLDGDGNLDIVATYFYAGSVGVSLGDGAGHFRTTVFYPAGDHPHHLALADLNHDGILDVVAADNGQPRVTVLLGNGTNRVGDGTFAPYHSYPLLTSSTGSPWRT